MRLTNSFTQQLINADKIILARGLPASPGAACGKIVLNADRAEEMAASGEYYSCPA